MNMKVISDLPKVTDIFTTQVRNSRLCTFQARILLQMSPWLWKDTVFHAVFFSESCQFWNETSSSVNPVENVWYFMIYTDFGKAEIGGTSWWIDVNKTATLLIQHVFIYCYSLRLDIWSHMRNTCPYQTFYISIYNGRCLQIPCLVHLS